MKIAVVGTGYVGLVTGTCFSEMGIHVTCVDVDEHKIESLKHGIIPIYEPGLETLVNKNMKSGRLRFTTRLEDVINEVDIVFIAVGTPPDEDGSADLKYVLEVARTIGRHINHYVVVATKSTMPVGTALKVRTVINDELQQRGAKVEFDVASNPEFLKEGNAVKDFHEGNLFKDYLYSFSTGEVLDTMRVSGKVLDAESKKPVNEIMVGLYGCRITNATKLDSLFERPLRMAPDFITKTDKEGRFTLCGLPDQEFLVFALNDMNTNLYYDMPNETVAYLDSLVPPCDSLTLYAFTEVDTTQMLLEKKYCSNIVKLKKEVLFVTP